MADVRADNEISHSEKTKLLEELDAALKAAEPIHFPTNIKLVQKYYEKLDAITFGVSEVDSRSTLSVVHAIRND